MRKTVFFWVKKLMERSYLLITEKFLFWSFQEREIRSFLSQKVDEKMILTGCWEVLVLNFSVMGNTAFFQLKSWWKYDIYLVFLSFPWYFWTWEIWFFAQWQLSWLDWVVPSHSSISVMVKFSISVSLTSVSFFCFAQ